MTDRFDALLAASEAVVRTRERQIRVLRETYPVGSTVRYKARRHEGVQAGVVTGYHPTLPELHVDVYGRRQRVTVWAILNMRGE